jgi:protoporphyrinogen oxidase
MDLIIGAGVSGISFANFSNNQCEIIEKEKDPGGYCKTIKRNGFVWDFSGHFFHFRNPEIEKFVRKNINEESLLKVNKSTFILYKDKFIDFPFQKNIHQLPQEEFIDCIYDLFAVKNDGPVKSFKAMVYQNLGKSIADKFLIPYNEKLYACDLDLLDQEAMGRFFPKASKEDIILNFRKQDHSSYNETFIYPKGGAIEYINSLIKNIAATPISLEEELISIDINKKEAITNKRIIRYDNLISTMPLPVLLKKCGIHYENVFSCNKVLVFNIGFDRKSENTQTSWLYIPDKEIIFYRVGFYDNILRSDRLSVYVEIGFPENAPINSTDEYLERVINDLRKCGLIKNEQVVDYEALIMNPAYVHINQNSSVAVMKYKALLAKSNIYSIGRYGSWTYCSIEDNIIEAKELAFKLFE